MPRTPSDFNSRGPKVGPKSGSKFGGRPSGGPAKGPGRDAPRSFERDEAPRAAKPAPRRDTMPVFDAEPERPARGAKPAGKTFAAKTFGAKVAASRDAREEGAGPARGKHFGKGAERGFERGGDKPFGKPFGKAGAKPTGPRGRPARDEGASPIAMPVKDASAPERIAKAMSRGGVASRRDAEKMILEGRVAVNGKVIDSPALTVTAKDKITIDGHVLAAPEAPRLWLYHKPEGLVTTARDELGRPTVFDDLPEDMPRVMSVGRLDLNSEGLLLLTNDGEIKRKLELPSTGWLRKYRVRVNGRPMDPDFEPLRQGIVIEGEVFAPMIVSLDRQQGANAWLTIAIREGRNREIRRAMEAVGYKVNRLLRVSYGPFQLGDLKPGEVAEVRPKLLRDQLGLADAAETEGYREADRGTRTTSRTITRGKPGAEGAKRGPAAKSARATREESFSAERSPYAPRSGAAERGERPIYGARSRAQSEDRPERTARPAFGDKARSGFASRDAGGERGERPTGGFGAKARSGFASRDTGAERGERPAGNVGSKPRSGFGARDAAAKPSSGFGAKPAAGFGGKPALSRGGARSDAPTEKPAWAREEGGKRGPAGAAAATRGKPFGAKPAGGKPFGAKPAGSKPFGGKPAGGKPAGGPGRKR